MKNYLITRTLTMKCEVEARTETEAIDIALDGGAWEQDEQCRNDVLNNCQVEEIK